MKKINLILILSIFLINVVSSYEINFSTNSQSSASNIIITQLKYEPYPVNPGEYFDLWIKAQWSGEGNPPDATFELLPQYPFSLDTNENVKRSFGKLNNEPVIMKYKVRVDKDAVEGVNDLKLRFNENGKDDFWNVESFDIQVVDAQTDFDLVIQESTSTDISIAIANVGKNTANSLIVRIPQQDNFRVTGTNGQMVGNLDSGDYTIVSFSLIPIGKNTDNLKVQFDYTDMIGERRSVIKDAQFISSPYSSNSTRIRNSNFTRGNFASQQPASSAPSKIWLWLIILIIIILIFYFKKNPDKIDKLTFKNKHKSDSKKLKSTPDWVSKNRIKKD